MLHVCYLFAQANGEVSFRHYDTKQGLPSTQIQGLFEDSRGYIWAITDRGAARFNGYEFTVLTTRDGLPTNNVLLINEDRKGRIWFMCNTGQYAFMEGDSILPYKGNERISTLLKDRLPGPFFFDDADTLWITTFSGIQLFKCFGDSVSEFIPQSAKEASSPTYYLRKVGKKLVTLQVGDITADNKISTDDNISYLLEVAGECKLACSVEAVPGTWAVAGPGGYVIFDESTNIQAFFNYSPYLFSTLEHDKTGHLWLTNSNGAHRIRNFRNGPDDSDAFFEGHFITAVLQDRAGNYWFGDRDNGVFFVPCLDVQVFNTGTPSKQNKCVALRKCGKDILYSDAQGYLYRTTGANVSEIIPTKIPSGVTLDFAVTSKGNIVIGNKPHLFYPATGKLVELDKERTVRRAISLSDGRCAFALADGLAFVDINEKWQVLPKEIYKERSNALFEDDDGTLFIGTNNGVYKYSGDSITPELALNQSVKPRVSDLGRWRDYLVIATRTAGLYLYKNEQVVVIDESHGLLSNTIDCIETLENGDIWIGSASGLQRLVIEDLVKHVLTWFRIDNQKGLPSNEVNDILFSNHRLLVATNSGMCSIDPLSPGLKGSTADVLLNHFSAGNTNLLLDEIRILKHDQNNIRFGFQSLNYRTGNNTRYRYMLSGVQNDWRITLNRTVDFWSLAPGKYVFEFAAMNEDGEWGTPQSVSFEITAHFTQTWWFKIAVLLSVLLISLLVLYLLYQSKKRKLIIRAKITELRQQALNANMNPHFIFNALGSIQHFINSGRAEEANEYLADFSKLIRSNLENNRHSLVDLEDEIEGLKLYLKLEKLRFGEKLKYQVNVVQDFPLHECMIPPMLLQPYVENALMHGILPLEEGGCVDIEVKADGEQYVVEIRDNGIGMKAALLYADKNKQSLAMKLNSERLAMLRELTGQAFEITAEDVSVANKGDRGTVITVKIPISIKLEPLNF